MKIPVRYGRIIKILLIIIVIAIAWALRWRAVTVLPVDYDEDDYLRAAQQYAALIRSGDWTGFTQTNYRPEHPPLAKIIFGVSILSAPEAPLIPDRSSSADPDQTLPKNLLRDARASSAVLGSLEVLLLALVNPLAGLFLAIHTFTIKYTSQVMLEAVPAFTSLAAILCYVRANKRKTRSGNLRGMNTWFILSAVFLGLTAASKYIYCVAGVAILIDWLIWSMEHKNLKRFFLQAFLWGLIAFLIFLLFDPYLWPSPIERLRSSVSFNAAYSTGTHVQEVGYPIWQPLTWLSMSVPWSGNRPAFVVMVDTFITLLAVFGVTRLWKKERLYGIWLGVAMVFLLLWPTKWPQYILTLTAPLSLAAVYGLSALVVEPIKGWLSRRKEKTNRDKKSNLANLRRVLPWLIPGSLFFITMALIPLLFEFGTSLTNLSSASIRDGLHGGILRAIWQGLTGQIEVSQITGRSNQVEFTGLNAFPYLINYISGSGLLFFNIMWTLLSVFLSTGLGLAVALLLWQKGTRFGRIWQALFILPWAIPEYIGALMWFNIFSPEVGWLALAVKRFGPNFPFSFFSGWESSTSFWLIVLLIPAVWYGFPFLMLAASAGLKMIPSDVFDAAAIDGADGWHTLRFIIWPLLAPLVIPAIIVRSIFAFNQFYLFRAFFVFDNGTMANLSYEIFYNGQYAISATINMATVLILIGFVVLLNRWSKASEGVNYA